MSVRRRAVRDGLVLAGVVSAVGAWVVVVSGGDAIDAHAYWANRPPVRYGAMPGADDAYLYSPAFAQLLAPLTALPWQAFLGVWTALLLVCLAAVVGPVLLLPALLLTWGELHYGNIHYLIAGALLLGFRHPGSWAFMWLSKVTPGIAVLWFAGAREWRKLATALAVTAAVTAISFAADPQAWSAWAAFLLGHADQVPAGRLVPLPLWMRVVGAAALVVWGGRTGRAWTVPVAVVLALPHGTIGLSVLVALVPLVGRRWRGSWRALLPVRSPGVPGTAAPSRPSRERGRYHPGHAERLAP